jgi:hypothetical protein
MRIIFVHLLWIVALTVLPVHAADEDESRHLPAAIETNADLRRHMESMLERSATFRQQCLRLEAPRLRVRIQRDPSLVDKPYRAITIISRSVDGDIVASVMIGSFGDPTEWLAHEIEHVLEQIEGIDVRGLVHARRGAWPSADGALETIRAIRAGKTVNHEMREGGRALARARLPEPPGRGDN